MLSLRATDGPNRTDIIVLIFVGFIGGNNNGHVIYRYFQREIGRRLLAFHFALIVADARLPCYIFSIHTSRVVIHTSSALLLLVLRCLNSVYIGPVLVDSIPCRDHIFTSPANVPSPLNILMQGMKFIYNPMRDLSQGLYITIYNMNPY